MDLPNLAGAPTADAGPLMRLLICRSCQSIDELPPHEGRPEDDVLLERCIDDLHTDAIQGAHKGLLFTVPVKYWSDESARKHIIRQIRQGVSGGIDELDPNYYNTRDNFRADALACFAAHQRPKGMCPDYLHPSKMIYPNTKAARKEMGLPGPKEARAGISLCRGCPVHVHFMTESRRELGMYK